MKKNKLLTWPANSLFWLTIIATISLSWGPLAVKADFDTPNPAASSSGGTTIFLPIIQKPIYYSSQSGNYSTYYISPNGSDSNSGTSETTPWATFDHAWQYLYPSDTLILLDGVYRQTLIPMPATDSQAYQSRLKPKMMAKRS